MNKDVIYIEPEDDITDIVTKIENSKEQIVAIVPPKKADILHSSINIRLIDKASKNADKKVVLVTTDTTVVKHAAAVKMPITKDLQTAPVIPSVEDEAEEEPLEDEADFDELKNKKSSKKKAEEEKSEEEEEEEVKESEEKSETEEEPAEEKAESEEESKEEKEAAEEDDKKSKKDKKKAKKEKKEKKDKGNSWFRKHRKAICIISPIVIVIIGVLYWALAIAPAVDIKVSVRTTVDKLSENVSFTANLEEENIAAGKFYYEEKKIETPQTVKFTATGQKNVGEKATGSVIVYHFFKQNGAIAINANSSFTTDGLTFYSTDDTTVSWDGNSLSACGNASDSSIVTAGCLVYARINVIAANSGSAYNIAAQQNANAWTTTADVAVYSDVAMAGGTDRTITIVTEADVTNAKQQLTSNEQKAGDKEKLFSELNLEEVLPIDSSFVQKTADIISTPAIGEEVAEGVEPSISTTITTTIYVVDMAKIREFITTQAKIPEKFLVYAIGNPFVENFTSIEGGFVGRLKTNYTYGPKLSEQGIIDLIKGVRIGNIKPILTDEGATNVEITRSYPWVGSVPNDVNKITVTIKEE